MNVCRDLNELTPETKYLANLLLRKCKEQGIGIQITETYRSQERQNELYAQGRTIQGKIVTWTLNSLHKTRKAFDFVPIVNGKANWNDLILFKRVGEIGKSIGLTWGGDWKTPDRPHFQYDGGTIKMEDKKEFVPQQINYDVQELVNKGIINSPDYWIGDNYSVDNVRALINKFANYIRKS